MSGNLVRLPGTKRLLRHLEAHHDDAVQDWSSTQALMVLTGCYLCAAGILLTVAWLALPYSPAAANEAGLLRVSVMAAVLGGVAIAFFDRIPPWAFQALVALGTVLVTVMIDYSGARTSPYAFFYIWLALYALFFFGRAQALVQVLFIAVAYAAVVVGDVTAGSQDGLVAIGEAAPRWIMTVGTLVVAVVLVGMLKERLDALVSRFADAAREDPLTGLRNRRGFDETFELEVERARRGGRTLALLVGDLDHFKTVNDRLGHPRGDDALQHAAQILRATNRRIDLVARVGGEEFAVLLPDSGERGAHIAAERMRHAIREGFADAPVPLTISFGIAAFPQHGETTDDLMESADQALYTAKEIGRDCSVIYAPDATSTVSGHARRRRARREARLLSLVTLAESLDNYEHAANVARHTREIAREVGYPEDRMEQLVLASLLHDVGKVGIPGSIVLKPGPLTPVEWAVMRKHSEIGASMLEGVEQDDLATWVRCHHERPDGTGYPRGLEGEEIPLEARIIAVADAYEAMTHDHVYRPAIGHDAACRELLDGAGTQFDPGIVDAFMRVLKTERGSTLRATVRRGSPLGTNT
jgi:diguanylate cyclase (GGDEF)-like protein